MKRKADLLTVIVLFIIACIVTGYFFMVFYCLPQVEAFEYSIKLLIVIFLLCLLNNNNKEKKC